MKTKPILAAAALLALCGMLFFQCKQKTNQQEEIKKFLTLFALQVQGKQIDSLVNHFNIPQQRAAITQLVNVLCNNTGANKKSKPTFKTALGVDEADINVINATTSWAKFPVHFSRDTDGVEARTSSLVFKVQEVSDREFKITEVQAREFFKEYVDYQAYVFNTIHSTDVTYSPQTVAAFKKAELLKTRYDSVVWFQHIDTSTYFYVVKGKFDERAFWSDEYLTDRPAIEHKMGLVGPSLTEVIPPQFDLIHNIGGTVDQLVEVEKGQKRGLYDLQGNVVAAAEYDEIFPLTDGDENLALLRKDDDYFYLKPDHSLSDKLADFKIADVLPRIKKWEGNFSISDTTLSKRNIMEGAEKGMSRAVIISPSYLADWKMVSAIQSVTNPLRKCVVPDMEESSEGDYHKVSFDKKADSGNWLTSLFYSIYDYYVGGRGGLYKNRALVLVDKKQNRIVSGQFHNYFGGAEGTGLTSGGCNENTMRQINDTLFEYKTTAVADQPLYSGEMLKDVSYYHYFTIASGKLKNLPNDRIFGFTKYVKMDDAYLDGCMVTEHNKLKHLNEEMLQYAKNEIYASYGYRFKDKKWQDAFIGHFEHGQDESALKDNVDDQLTAIDKYNIAFINQKLKAMGGKPKVLAAK